MNLGVLGSENICSNLKQRNTENNRIFVIKQDIPRQTLQEIKPLDIIADTVEQVMESEETIAVEDILLGVDVSMTIKAITEAITMDHREKLVEDWKIEADVQIAVVPGLNTPRDILDDVPDRNSHGQEDTINTLGVIGSTTSTLNMLTSTEILKINQIQERKLIRTRQFKMEAVTEMEAPAFWREAQLSYT